MEFVTVDDEMKLAAEVESVRRGPHIRHHFDPNKLTPEERDAVGFMGEFACCKYLGIDWKHNIRDNYLTIDDFDLVYKGKRVDVKTETLPRHYALNVLNRTINDNVKYGRRLVNEKQLPLLSKYDMIIFGLFMTGDYDKWYPIGYLESRVIMTYPAQKHRPDGGAYPDRAAAIPTSHLKPMNALI